MAKKITEYTYEELMEYVAKNHTSRDMVNDCACKEDNGIFPWEM